MQQIVLKIFDILIHILQSKKKVLLIKFKKLNKINLSLHTPTLSR